MSKRGKNEQKVSDSYLLQTKTDQLLVNNKFLFISKTVSPSSDSMSHGFEVSTINDIFSLPLQQVKLRQAAVKFGLSPK